MKREIPKTISEAGVVLSLPKPDVDGGKSVLAALRLRKSERNIGAKKIPTQMLSNLLWAAFGVNRTKGPFGFTGRTAASASNSQEIDLYIALEGGLYLYEPTRHCLQMVAEGDSRPLVLGQGQGLTGAKAPVRIIYVVDTEKFSKAGFQEPGLWNKETQKAYYFVDTGLIAGNVYLYAASIGLAAWFHNCDKVALADKLKLRPSQRVLFGQTVGYSKS